MNRFKEIPFLVLVIIIVVGFCGCDDNSFESSVTNNGMVTSEVETSSKSAEDTNSILDSLVSSQNSTSSALPQKDVSSSAKDTNSILNSLVSSQSSTSSALPQKDVSSKPDANEEKSVNIFGNTVGNLNNNHGIAAAQGEYIYFSSKKGVYKVKDSKMWKLSDDASLTLNVYGDWVYYRLEGTGDFYRVKTNGTQKELFLKDIDMMYIVKGRVYYTENDKLYSMNPDKTDKKLVIQHEDISYNLNITEDKIYWGNNVDLCIANIDGSGFREYSDVFSQSMIIYKGKKYTSGLLHKSNIDGTDQVELNGAGSMEITIQDDWIYFISSSEGYQVYKIKTDGTGKQLLSKYHTLNVCAVGDWLYVGCYDKNGEYRTARMKTDGSDFKFLKQ